MYKRISAIFVFLVLLSVCVFGDSLDALWQEFLETSDPETKAGMLVTMGILGSGNQEIINNINNYLMETNSVYVSGKIADYSLVSASITALMELNDSSSFPVLFNVLCTGYPEVIASEAYGALDLIDGNLMQFLSNIIFENPPEEKFVAFKAGINSERLSLSERGRIAELALEISLASNANNADLSAMRYSAIWALTSLRWTRANHLAIRHYYHVMTDYYNGAASKARLIEAIACLGAVGNSDAALALGLQLGLINARTENTGIFDSDITLAIVQALGLIGSKSTFDHLLYTSNLSYNENIRAAAREALDRLRW